MSTAKRFKGLVMTIRINLDIMMAKRKMRLKTLAKEVGITEANLSVLKNGKAKAVRLSTLDKLCEVLDCQPGDILEFEANIHEESATAE
jgi:putative transcriptional regulator